MKDNIFSELYNKLLGFFHQAEEEENSKDVARNRLRVVLMQDRTNLTPQLLERMRSELVELLSKYLEMDKEALELNLDQDGEQMALALSIPVIRAKDEEEIEKAIAEEEEKKEQNITEDSDDAENNTENDKNEVEESSTDIVTEETDENSDIIEEKVPKNKKRTKSADKSLDKEVCGDSKESEQKNQNN